MHTWWQAGPAVPSLEEESPIPKLEATTCEEAKFRGKVVQGLLLLLIRMECLSREQQTPNEQQSQCLVMYTCNSGSSHFSPVFYTLGLVFRMTQSPIPMAWSILHPSGPERDAFYHNPHGTNSLCLHLCANMINIILCTLKCVYIYIYINTYTHALFHF